MQLVRRVRDYFGERIAWRGFLFVITAGCCLTGFVSAPAAMALGFLLTTVFGNPFGQITRRMTPVLLQVTVAGLGFGIDLPTALAAGRDGFGLTLLSLTLVLVAGALLTRLLGIRRETGFLISAGTAICGGSAIAAMSPVVKAGPDQVSVSLAVIFLLNAVALLVFPPAGHLLQLTGREFGLWCALAIQDTSSVVGAAAKYGDEALAVATTVKLARALWIIPLSGMAMILFRNSGSKVRIPWFILGFSVVICLHTWIPGMARCARSLAAVSKAGMVLTLFLIGTGLSVQAIRSVGVRPLLLAVVLWVLVASVSLWLIR